MESFNVFSMLSGISGKSAIHSRFLEALLVGRHQREGNRENLADFLNLLSNEISNFDSEKAAIYRGFGDFDTVIYDELSRQVILVEIGIRKRGRIYRLQEFAKNLQIQGYTTHLVWAVLDEQAYLEVERRNFIFDCTLLREEYLSWLKRCQQRAYNEPPLRESIGQYRHLVAKITGTDYSEDYMNELIGICLRDENFLLVHDLKEAMVEAQVRLVYRLWQEIVLKLEERIPDLPELSEDVSDISEGTIRRFIADRKFRWHGLFYGFTQHAFLGVVAKNSICFGVVCSQKMSVNKYRELKESLDRGKRGRAGNLWQYPWGFEYLNLRNPRRDDFKVLTSKKQRKKYVEEIVSGLHGVWGRVKEAGLA